MDVSRVSASELIQERVEWVAARMRVTPATARRYLTDEAVRELARTVVMTVADEAPGADVLADALAVRFYSDGTELRHSRAAGRTVRQSLLRNRLQTASW